MHESSNKPNGTPSDAGRPLADGLEMFGAIQLKLTRAKIAERVFGDDPEPIRIGRYVTIRTVGSGGMGTVWEAYDQQLGRRVALKLLNSISDQRQDMVERLQREAQALARLSHPNVVTVYEVGEDDGRGYISMEFVDGPDLREYCHDRDWRRTLDVFMDAGRGLAAAHAAGIFHRDFKPSNVLVGADGRVRVLDFGLARGSDEPPLPLPATIAPHESLNASSSLLRPITRSGQVMGTPRYMAPEQCVGGTTCERSDQFSFCVALYEALYGEMPFEGKTVDALREAALAGEVRPVPTKTDVPVWVRRAIVRGLSGAPADRFPSMDALLGVLGRDPKAWVLRTLIAIAALSVIAAALLWLKEVRGIGSQLRADVAQTQTGLEERRRHDVEIELQAREDGLTLREIRELLRSDPTRAVAMLRRLSEHAQAWDGEARMIASDAAHLGIARSALDVPDVQDPHGISPDATLLATRDPTEESLHLVDTRTGQSRTLAASGVAAPFVEFSSDARLLAAKRVDDTIGVWTLADDKYRALGTAPPDHQFLAFFGRGARLVSYGRNPDVYVWDVAKGTRTVLGDHDDGAVAALVSADGTTVATVDGYGVLRKWDLATTAATTLTGNTPIAFAPDGTLLATVGAGDVVMYPASGGPSDVLHGVGEALSHLQVCNAGDRVAAAKDDGGVIFWELATGRLRRLPGHDTDIVHLGFLEECRFVVTTSTDNTLGIWDTHTPHAQRLRGHRGVGFWAVDRDRDELVTVGWEGQVRRWDLPPSDLGPSPGSPGHIEAIAHGPGGHVATGAKNGTVREWDGSRWQLVTKHDTAVRSVAYSKDGKRLASGDERGEVHLRDAAGKIETLPPAGSVAAAMDISTNGQRLVVMQEGDGIAIYDLDTASLQETFDTAPFKPRFGAMSEDGKQIVAVGWVRDGPFSIRTYDAATGEQLAMHLLPDMTVMAAVVSPTGDRVALTTSLRGTHVWDASTGVARHLGDHSRPVYGIAIAPDGRRIATASEDETVRLWDAETGRSRTVDLRQQGLRAIAFAPDGMSFATGGREQLVYVGRDDLPRDQAGLRKWIDATTSFVATAQPLD